jgi:FkbM family methyltransferase
VKLDFDPKKNITALDYFIMPLNINRRIKDLLAILSMVKNWYDILLFRMGMKKPGFVMQLRNGKKIEIKKTEDYFNFWSTEEGQMTLLKQAGLEEKIKIDRNKKIIKLKFLNRRTYFTYDSNKQLVNTVSLIKEQFIDEQYSWLNVKNRVVIDIGANIGDSAIYFALKGAKHVYAFEPYPYSYGLAIRNIRLNGLEDKVTLLNEGCGRKKGKIKIDTSYKNLGGTDLKNFKNGTNIIITTLGKLVKRFGITEEAVLKIDCEGCEYGVLLGAQDSDLRRFKQIQIEYHYGYLNIKRKLKDSEFKVTNTLPKYATDFEAENKDIILGLIYAERS